MAYEITVYRSGQDTGTLTYDGEKIKGIVTECWYDARNRIPAQTYTGCSATKMLSGLAGVFIPDVKGFRGIFVQPGSSPRIPRPVFASPISCSCRSGTTSSPRTAGT